MENHPEDDLILPEYEDSLKTTTPEPKSSTAKPHHIPKKSFLLTILAAISFIGLAGALLFVVLNNNPSSNTTTSETDSSFKYSKEEFGVALDCAEERLVANDFSGAESCLSNFSIPERMTASQRYRYYNTLVKIYGAEGRNEPDRAEIFERYAKESLEAIMGGEE